ncbi:MAG: adenine methylase [Sphingomonadales bacterium]|jgi:DNA adenine methylase|nr:adenine methylase [Sphingomonadales bacterium]
MTPFLKWPGGKRWFVRRCSHLLPTKYNRYYEPFLGGGSVFFHLRPPNSVIGDCNPDVVAVFSGLKKYPSKISEILAAYQLQHNADFYYEMRALPTPEDPAERAARILYLNRTCFNGIYRVNRLGRFNVPIGTKTAVVLPSDGFAEVAAVLSQAEIRKTDFEPVINEAATGDFLFVDPPYTVRHSENGFIKYNEKLFSWADQERLAVSLERARLRGVQIVMTNADHASLRELYQDSGFAIEQVNRYSSISANSGSRRHFSELVIRANTITGS